MKFKVLKDFISSIVNGIAGEVHEKEVDEPTAAMWTNHGLIEEVKDELIQEDTSKPVEPSQNVENVPQSTVEGETVTPIADSSSTADTAPVEAVSADENK
jgi:hypothetical protein